MATTIRAGNGTNGGAGITSDATGILEIRTGTTSGAGTTAMTIDASQNTTFAGAVTSSGNQTVTGNLTVNGNTTLGDANTDTILMTAAPSIGGAGLGMGFGFRNRIINGNMVIDQRNAGASVTPSSGQYMVDRWFYGATQTSKLTAQQNAGAVTPPLGFGNYLGFTSTSAYSVLTGDTFYTRQGIEGFNFSDFGWGTANAQPATISFWVRSSLTGTFGGSLGNSSATRSYPFLYTISAANTWEYKTITVAGDTTGTWIGATNGVGVYLYIGLGSGATFSGTANSWAAGNLHSVTGATSVVGTNGATFYITGVQLEKGSTATSFDYRPYGTELQLCQRYYWQLPAGSSFGAGLPFVGAGQAWSTTNTANHTVLFPVTMRVTPTLFQSGLQLYSPNLGAKSATIALGAGQSTVGTTLNTSASTGLTGGNMWYISGVGNATDYVGFGAEL